MEITGSLYRTFDCQPLTTFFRLLYVGKTKQTGENMHKIIRLPEVKALTGLSRSTIYQKIIEKTFPTQISLGPKSVGWLENDVQNWIQEKIAQSQTTLKR